MMFALHPQLEADTHFVNDWSLSRVLLMDDRRYPWLILVPRRAGISEIYELESIDRALLIEEVARASKALSGAFAPDKINVAALGNVVRQLHIHVVGRRKDDAAQPGLVWGSGLAQRYSASERKETMDLLSIMLASP